MLRLYKLPGLLGELRKFQQSDRLRNVDFVPVIVLVFFTRTEGQSAAHALNSELEVEEGHPGAEVVSQVLIHHVRHVERVEEAEHLARPLLFENRGALHGKLESFGLGWFF